MNPQIHNQEAMLRESIKHFLTSHHRSGSSDYSSFESIFFRLIQTMLDPPLEITWFYSAVTYHAAKTSSRMRNPSARAVVAKDLLNLLISCSNLSSASKRIALLAPVVYELYDIVCDDGAGRDVVRMEVGRLVEDMVDYIVMSAAVYDYGSGEVRSDNAVVCFEDLVRVWTTDRGGGCCGIEDNLRAFFPLLSDGTWKRMRGRCGVRELVGVVMCEVFFLKLYTSFGSGPKEIRDQAVQTIKGFRNSYFVDMLFKMMLEPSLPVASLLSSEDADILHEALYDAILLVDYAFYSGRWAQSNDPYSRKLAVLWLLVANRATQFARAKNDQDRANLYLNAFNESSLIAGLIRWASTQAGVRDQNIRPDVTSPNALIKWLFMVEGHGATVFEEDVSLWYAKAISKGDVVAPEVQLLGSNEVDLMNVENDITRKRKEPAGDTETSLRQAKRVVSISEVRCGTEVVNVSSDDEMES